MKNIKTYESFNQQSLNFELLHYSNNIASLNKMRELLKNGADPNCKDGLSMTPLYNACRNFFYSGIKLLIENGADVNLATKTNMTPFYALACSGKYMYRKQGKTINNIVDILIENGADLSINPINTDWYEQASAQFVEYVEDKYPEKFEEYLMKKEAGKYNL